MNYNEYDGLIHLIESNQLDDDNMTKIQKNNYSIFLYSCSDGHKDIAEWLYNLSLIPSNTKIDIHAENEYPFRWSCYNGHKGIAEWLYNLSLTPGNTLALLAKNDNNASLDNTKIDIHAENEYAFRWSCINGHKDIAEWLYNLSLTAYNTLAPLAKNNNTSSLLGNIKIDIHTNNEEAFRQSCSRGHKDIAEWLYNLSLTPGNTKINIHADNEYAFRSSCSYGHKDIADWLHNLSLTPGNTKIDIHAGNEHAFISSCYNGYKDIAEWLYDLSLTHDNTKIDIHAVNECAFRLSCSNGHKDIAQWLYNLSLTAGNTKIDIHAENEHAFTSSCSRGHKDIAEWLYNLSLTPDNTKIDIHANNEFTFRKSCSRGHKDIAEWLCTLCNSYEIKYDSNGYMIAYIRNIKTFLLEHNTEEIERLLDGSGNHKSEDCMVCLSNDSPYWIKLDCNHQVCSDCFIVIDQCPYRCNEFIELRKINIYKSIE